jgi:anaerobic selenocysteine-containing dehydrogenase
MATQPADELEMIAAFGPHLSAGTLASTSDDPDRLVKRPRATPTWSCPGVCTRRTRARSPRSRAVIKIDKAVDCPGEAKQDWVIIQDIARALGREKGFTFRSPREIFEELRVASRGGVADYSGITYEEIEREMGVFWPLSQPRPGHGRAARRPSRHAAAVRARQLQPHRPGQGSLLFYGRQGALQRSSR